jgi:hypothetical protein
MWVRGAAIRPVPRYAVVTKSTLDQIECELADDSPTAQSALDGAFSRFESTQPQLADAISQVLSNPLDETALALGYFLSIAIWLAFERTFGAARLRQVSSDALSATDEAITLEEELRAAHGDEPLDLDDIVSVEQPNVLAFVHEHVDAALDPETARRSVIVEKDPRAQTAPAAEERGAAGSQGSQGSQAATEPTARVVDVDDVRSVYRAIVLLTLCLSHAVVPVDDASRGSAELLA